MTLHKTSTRHSPSSKVKARAETTAGPTVSVSTIVDFSTVSYDSGGNITTGAAWKFVTSKEGYYRVGAQIFFSTTAWTAGSTINLKLFKNGVHYSYLDPCSKQATGSFQMTAAGVDTIYLAIDDYIDVRVDTNQGNKSLTASAGLNYITIEEV